MKQFNYIALLTAALSCVSPTMKTASTISETDTGCIIEGLIQYSNGNPVSNASVILHDQQTLHIITLAKQKALVRSNKTTTNINGIFQIDSVDTGKYLVEINAHDTLGALLPAQVAPSDTLVQVNATLGRLGSILGRIDTGKITIQKNMVMYLPEINRTVSIDSSGYFIITNLPAYNYHLHFAVGDSLISLASDSIHIPVSGGDTTRIESLGSKSGPVIINGRIVETPNAN